MLVDSARAGRSISGHQLAGEKIVRLVYLDEAGIGNANHEPYIVVAGPIVNPDNSTFEIERHLRGIARRYVADPYDADAVIFHATDLWHGSRIFDRKSWPRDTRFRILRDLLSIPQRFDLPIVWGTVLRSEVEKAFKYLGSNRKKAASTAPAIGQGVAFVGAMMQVEAWMKENARSERALVIAENSPQARTAIKMFHGGYRRFPSDEGLETDAFVSNHIVEEVLFAEKNESAILQIADIAAFFIRRQLMGKTDSAPLFELIKPRLSKDNNRPEAFLIRVSENDVIPIEDYPSDPSEVSS